MIWKIRWHEDIEKDFKKIDKLIRKKIINYMEKRVAIQKDPRVFGKGLSYDKFGLWRYRVEDYRIICRLIDSEIEILVINVGHRKIIYHD